MGSPDESAEQSYDPRAVLAGLAAFIVASEQYQSDYERLQELGPADDSRQAAYVRQYHDQVLFMSSLTINNTLEQLHQSGYGLAYVGPASQRPLRIAGVHELDFNNGGAVWNLENHSRPETFQTRFIRSYAASD